MFLSLCLFNVLLTGLTKSEGTQFVYMLVNVCLLPNNSFIYDLKKGGFHLNVIRIGPWFYEIHQGTPQNQIASSH